MAETITKQQLFKALLEHKYLIYKDGQPLVTQDFYRDFSDPSKMEVKEQITVAAKLPISPPSEGIVQMAEIEKLEESVLTKFIIDAKIPEKAKTRNGSYYLNKYNSKAEKILVKALKEKVHYKVLVISTLLYYKSGTALKTIANYFLEGIWKDEYNKLADQISGKTAVQINTYINGLLKEGKREEEGTTSYKRS